MRHVATEKCTNSLTNKQKTDSGECDECLKCDKNNHTFSRRNAHWKESICGWNYLHLMRCVWITWM